MVSVPSSLTGNLVNTATVAAPMGTTDPTPGNNTATDTDTPDIYTDLEITKVSTPDPVEAGQNLTYTITVTNHGPSDAQSVSVTDVLPAGLILISAIPSAGMWVAPTWTIGTLASGATVDLVFVAQVHESVPHQASLINTATVSSPTPDTDSDNNTDTETTDVCNIIVEAGNPASVCKTRNLSLAGIGASITPALVGGVWSTSGDGIFVQGDGTTVDNTYAGAVFYKPGANDIALGEVILTLTSNASGLCDPKADSVSIEVLDVGCGNFPWDGN
ncbi:MAG: DUF11 domain-containing protein [Saprospirales bacterium]|nr:DUF11 domain-containing protein [Saprospirales bacterium]